MKVNAIIFAPTQEAALMIVVIAGIVIATQPFKIAKARITMLNLKIDQGPTHVAYKTLITIMELHS